MILRLSHIITCILLVGLVSGLAGREVFRIDKTFEAGRNIPSENVTMYIDETNEVTVDEILAGKLTGGVYLLSNKLLNASHWMEFEIIPTQDHGWSMEFHDPHISYIEFYTVKNGEAKLLAKTGYNRPFEQKATAHKNFVFEIPPSVSPQKYLIRIIPDGIAYLGLHIKPTHHLLEYATQEYYFLGLFYGILLLMAVYNFILYLSIREKTHLYYVFYILVSAMYAFNEDGLGFQFLWPNLPFLNMVSAIWTPPLLMIFFQLYATSFLNLETRYPKAIQWIVGSMILYVIVVALDGLQWIPHALSFYALDLSILITYSYAFKSWKAGYKPARFFIVAFTVIVFVMVSQTLRIHGIITEGLWIVYGFNFAIVTEIVLFSYSLGDKIKITKEEKERAQAKVIEELERNEKLKDKVNRELEQQVALRTKELENRTSELMGANNELNELKEELYSMNQQLDKDNWQLKKKVEDANKMRIVSQEMSLDDFTRIFPDNRTCLDHLEKIKWKNGFACPKCGHDEYRPGPKAFSRKCTKCKHPDSATAGTLFHSLKFPINKAFFICYLASVRNQRYTVDELSEMLEMRRNTCWKFRKKVLDRKEDFVSRGLIENNASWEDMIVNR